MPFKRHQSATLSKPACANATLFAYGIEYGWISPTTKILQSDASPTGYPLSDNSVAWIASSMSMSAIFGVSLYSYIADTYGRKIGVILIAIPEAISWIIKLCYASTATLIIARLFSGLAAGGCYIIVPMYVKEISQDDIRGILGTFIMLMQTAGILVIYLLGAYLDYFTVVIVALILPIVTCCLLIKAPESPAYLVKRGKIEEATRTVALLRGLDEDDKIIANIVERMKNEDAHFKSLPKLSIAQILRDKTWRRDFILIIVTFLFHGLNGAYAIVTYASTILISTGVKFDINPEIQAFSFPIVMIIGSIALAIVIERFGRRPLLIGSFLISAIAMTTIAMLMIIQQQGGSVPSWLPVAAIILSVAMYGAGISTLPYIIMTEMFSFQIRAKVMGVVVTFAWFLSFLLVTIYAPMTNTLGQYSPFIFYAVINLTGAVFTMAFLPETKGKGEVEIHQLG
ncbi:unnamed protein product [Euphydryas editha]|uniref:Major facilitator superfamily (MFS) profile domain-containing protein n=1 Tax=Euphydryas editha TaxID=104508 RepID=A0AAU9UJ25_EUPED|nr:unnamed protein product [Euphydryas editha]